MVCDRVAAGCSGAVALVDEACCKRLATLLNDDKHGLILVALTVTLVAALIWAVCVGLTAAEVAHCLNPHICMMIMQYSAAATVATIALWGVTALWAKMSGRAIC